MSANTAWTMTASRWIDWPTVRDTINLAEVATRLLGPAPGRRGERQGRRLWWPCPLGTHQDRNPSFSVRPGDQYWKCFGCGESGDVATLVMKVNGMSFPEAKAFLTSAPAPARPSASRPRPAPEPPAGASDFANWRKAPLDRPSLIIETPAEPQGMTEADALALMAEAERRLWSPEGVDALAYLHGRGLTDETIRAARLGWAPKAAGAPWKPPGIVIPWLDGDRLALVKIRPPDGWRERFPKGKRPPKYIEAFRNRPTIYPGPSAVRPCRPLVIVEGELDTLLLGQELSDVAAVVTLGSASARPGPALLGRMLAAAPWLVATDADEAGDRSAADWPTITRRIRPPASFKDWTEARQAGVHLRRWWSDRLGGTEAPPLFTWPELAALRWSQSVADPSSGIVIDRPDRGRMLGALQAADDPDAIAERLAIQEESSG